jgi:hypothetical protein
MVEDGVGQGQSLPADLQPAIGKVVNVDQLSCQCRRVAKAANSVKAN